MKKQNIYAALLEEDRKPLGKQKLLSEQPALDAPSPADNTKERSPIAHLSSNQASKQSSKLGSLETSKQASDGRKKIRNTFDIFADQMLSLKEIALQKEQRLNKRIYIADMVQEALDMYITREQKRD